MKFLLTILLFTTSCVNAQIVFFQGGHSHKIVLPVGRDGIIYQLNAGKSLNIHPGDTLLIPNVPVQAMKLLNFQGTPDSPVVITSINSSRPVGGYKAYSLVIDNARYFKLTGITVSGAANFFSIGNNASGYTVEKISLPNGAMMLPKTVTPAFNPGEIVSGMITAQGDSLQIRIGSWTYSLIEMF